MKKELLVEAIAIRLSGSCILGKGKTKETIWEDFVADLQKNQVEFHEWLVRCPCPKQSQDLLQFGDCDAK